MKKIFGLFLLAVTTFSVYVPVYAENNTVSTNSVKIKNELLPIKTIGNRGEPTQLLISLQKNDEGKTDGARIWLKYSW